MPFQLKVSNLENNTTWEKQLTSNEYKKVEGCLKSEEARLSVFIPIRTNNLKNLSIDLFLPTTLNHAIIVENTAVRICAIVASVFLDLLTLPFRAFFLIPRIITNSMKAENLFKKYLLAEGVDKKLLESDHVKIKLEWETTSIYPTSHWTDKNGVKHSKHGQIEHYLEQNINFIEVPAYKGSDGVSSGSQG